MLLQPTIPTVAVIGTGVIGRSWIRVFARAGCHTRVFDPDQTQQSKAVEWAESTAAVDERLRFLAVGGAANEKQRIAPCASLSEALVGAGWVQESGPEALETKQRIYRELDAEADDTAILASSTSAHDMTAIASGLSGADRCVVAHPVNPPHVVPVVEVLAGRTTRPDVTETALAFLESVGQTPVEMHRYVPGFLLNRLQAALIREAVSLIGSDVASAEAIDAVVRDGLGLRWALMGPFGTGHTNADGGAGEYYRRYGDAYRALWADLDATPEFSDRVIDRIHSGTEAMYGPDSAAAVGEWRDRLVRGIRRLKADDPAPTPETGGA